MYFPILEYVLISSNKLCSERSMLSITTTSECEIAKSAIGISGSVRLEATELYPNGCYVHDNGNVFFNLRSIGTREGNSSPICQSFG